MAPKAILVHNASAGIREPSLESLTAMIEAAGYRGPQEVEIFSRDNWWTLPGDEVVRTCVERFETVC